MSALVTLIFQVAFRNLWLYRFRSLIIAALLGIGSFLAVFGLTMLGDVETSMRTSVTQSVAGDLQVYSNKAKDELAIFGFGFMGRAELDSLPDLARVRDIALANPNVRAFVPMGLDMAVLGRGNELDDTIDALRAAYKAGDPSIVKERVEQLSFQREQLLRELAERRKISSLGGELDKQEADLAKVAEPAFLAALQQADEGKLQFLETKIAPLSGEKPWIYLSYLGTDIEQFRQHFPKLRIVEGEALPQGKRGIMLSRKMREDFLKNLAARLLDRLKKRTTKERVAIKGDADNERDAAELKRQYALIVSYLDRGEAEELSKKLDAMGIKGEGGDLLDRLTKQLTSFLTVDDDNLLQRHEWFYANIAPKIQLYEISPGETITLRSYTRSGYLKSVPLKVYGVFTFDGLEDSDLAGQMNLIDLVSFRELYGQMTEESRKELEAMRQAVGLKEVSAADAEAALFGDASQARTSERAEGGTSGGGGETLQVKPVIQDHFDPAEVRKGLAINAAIQLKDAAKQAATLGELEEAFKAQGLDLRVVTWQKAAGFVGQMAVIVGSALVFALFVIFLVSVVIINNTIIVSTLNRIREIGTMRAIGAQKSFVVGLFLAETGITGLGGALIGALLAGAALSALHTKGIPAGSDFISFLFGGPRLYPSISWPLLASVPLVTAVIATVTSVYAARHAARVRPSEAMQEKE